MGFQMNKAPRHMPRALASLLVYTTPVATTNGTTTTFTDTGLHDGTTYFYNVAANNSVGISPDSNEVTVTPAATTGIPAAPAGLAAVRMYGTQRATGYGYSLWECQIYGS
jgi:hypothetical protein